MKEFKMGYLLYVIFTFGSLRLEPIGVILLLRRAGRIKFGLYSNFIRAFGISFPLNPFSLRESITRTISFISSSGDLNFKYFTAIKSALHFSFNKYPSNPWDVNPEFFQSCEQTDSFWFFYL